MVAALISSTPPEMHGILAAKARAKEAWASIRTRRLSSDRVCEANTQRLRAEFEDITFKDGECVDDFAMTIGGLATQLHSLGDTIDDQRIVQKFLCVVPSHFAQVAISIETLLGLHTLSIEELMGRLRVFEDE